MSTTAHLSWELPVERPKKRIIETKWQLARWPPTRARSEPEENIKLHYWSESGVGGRGRKPFNYLSYPYMKSGQGTPGRGIAVRRFSPLRRREGPPPLPETPLPAKNCRVLRCFVLFPFLALFRILWFKMGQHGPT